MKNPIFHLEAYVASYGVFFRFGGVAGWGAFFFFFGKKATSKIWVLLSMIFNEILCIFANFGRIWAFEGPGELWSVFQIWGSGWVGRIFLFFRQKSDF